MMYATMNICIDLTVIFHLGIHHFFRFLRGGCVIKIHQRFSVYLLVKYGKIFTYLGYIELHRNFKKIYTKVQILNYLAGILSFEFRMVLNKKSGTVLCSSFIPQKYAIGIFV